MHQPKHALNKIKIHYRYEIPVCHDCILLSECVGGRINCFNMDGVNNKKNIYVGHTTT
jgi:hypothetical protein